MRRLIICYDDKQRLFATGYVQGTGGMAYQMVGEAASTG
jgi:hypothetical protein